MKFEIFLQAEISRLTGFFKNTYNLETFFKNAVHRYQT